MIFSGREQCRARQAAPDLYLHAADALGVPRRPAIIRDSPVGVEGAIAVGAEVIRASSPPPSCPARPSGSGALGGHHIRPNSRRFAPARIAFSAFFQASGKLA